MDEKIRRSWLVVPLSRQEALSRAAHTAADVVVLDLVELVAEKDKPAARDAVRTAIDAVRVSGAEVFVQVDAVLLYADLHACVWPGVSGVVISRAESPQHVVEADGLLARLEAERGILPRTLEIVAALETARGNHEAYGIGTASERVWGLTLGRADLVMDLRPEPAGEIHLLPYLMQRLITVACAIGITPLGAWWRPPDRGLLATPERTYEAACRGRAIGFRGAMCLREEQVEPLNRGFSPAAAEVEAARQVLAAYEVATAQGNAAVKHDGRLIDAGTAAQARRVLALAAACEAHDRARAAGTPAAPSEGTVA